MGGADEHHGQKHHGHKHDDHDRFGNPQDLAAYLARLEDPARAEWQKPDEVIRAIGVARGMTVGEIGAGPGFFTKRLAAAVGGEGRVFAAEVEPRILEVLRERLAGITNVTPILADPSDPRFPRASCDRILLVNTYHHFADGSAYLRRIAAALKPGGRIVNVDFEDRETPVGPPLAHRVSREDFLRDAQAAGLSVVEDAAMSALALPHQYAILLAARG